MATYDKRKKTKRKLDSFSKFARYFTFFHYQFKITDKSNKNFYQGHDISFLFNVSLPHSEKLITRKIVFIIILKLFNLNLGFKKPLG